MNEHMNDYTEKPDLITFLTDFGLCGGEYVAACEAVVTALAPGVRVLHISHEVGVGDIRRGALILARVAPLCPASVHLAVVDPGVGTDRRPVVLSTERGDLLVGPDNGLLIPASEALGGVRAAWLIDPDRLRRAAGLPEAGVSRTFHARDVFAPAAALLVQGMDETEIARPFDAASLIVPEGPVVESTPESITAEVIEVDRFGNVGLAARFDDCAFPTTAVTVEVAGEELPVWNARVVDTFGQLQSGELGVYRDSWGQVALALNGASAAQLLALAAGMMVRVGLHTTS